MPKAWITVKTEDGETFGFEADDVIFSQDYAETVTLDGKTAIGECRNSVLTAIKRHG